MCRRVLMLCYFFPPLSGGGVQRSAKFAKYLPTFGWEPVIISVKPNSRNTIEQGIDQSLLEDVSPDTEVHRCNPIELSHLYALLHRLRLRKILFEVERLVPFLHMDYKIGWYVAGIQAARRRMPRWKPNILYSSSPPYSSHLMALHLHRKHKCPWVADFRDPWTQIANYEPATMLNAAIDSHLEEAVVRNSTMVIANTAENCQNLVARYNVPKEKIVVIPNGFDPEDFKALDSKVQAKNRFVITCVGKFYDMPDPGVFFRAFRSLSDLHNSAFLRLVGWHSRSVRNAANAILRPGTWESRDRVEHDAAITMMKQSTILLANLPGESATHWIPGKLYEYLASERPIILVGPTDGDAARLIQATRTGIVSGFDYASILSALQTLYEMWLQGFDSWHPDASEVSKYNRRLQARSLAQIFDSLEPVSGAVPLHDQISDAVQA